MKDSKIAWTDHTFNPWWGCVKVSDGCKNCYAATFSKRTGNDIWGVDKPRRFFGDKHWAEPLKWNHDAGLSLPQKNAKVFCASMADVYESRADLVSQRSRLFKLIEITPRLTWLILTKRPDNILSMGTPNSNNFWLGTTVEDREAASWRLDCLLDNPAPVHFVSVEPQLEVIDLLPWLDRAPIDGKIDWVICGGESGAGCRSFNPDWARLLQSQCSFTDTAFFMKQLGGVQNHHADLADFPEDLRIREFPRLEK